MTAHSYQQVAYAEGLATDASLMIDVNQWGLGYVFEFPTKMTTELFQVNELYRLLANLIRPGSIHSVDLKRTRAIGLVALAHHARG